MSLPDGQGYPSYLMDLHKGDEKIRGEFYVDYDQLAIVLESSIQDHLLDENNSKQYVTNGITSQSSHTITPGQYDFGAILLMVASNAYSGFIMSSTSNETFEREFANIPEVKIFVEKYPDYTTSHSGDFLGWKVIFYDAKINDDKYVHLHVKKSVLHQRVIVNAGCSDGNFGFTYNVQHEQVMDYLINDKCSAK